MDFDGKRAMAFLDALCAIGPRISGTAGMDRQRQLIVEHFNHLGRAVHVQPFTARQLSKPRAPIAMANLMVSFQPQLPRRVILCTHYDTRPIADQEPDRRKWREPFVSANDGGSGVAFIMELAHQMMDVVSRVGVDFVFFDGEEVIFEPDTDAYFFGSEHFARAWKQNPQRPDYAAAILLDMIAGPNPSFPIEAYSWLHHPSLCETIWGLAKKLGCNAFRPRLGQAILDDHIPLQNAGIPAIDIIDFAYPHWHKLSDVPAHCHPEGMIQVARVLTAWLRQVNEK